MRILAVDDDPINLDLIEQFIADLGDHDLATAGSARAALERLDAGETVECFMLDIQMPEMDGIDLTRRLRERADHADTPVLMLTAMSDKRYIDWAFAAGATDYVTKPFEITDLRSRLAVVESQLAKRQAHPLHLLTGPDGGNGGPFQPLKLDEAISIYDIDNVIGYMAMENYVARLTRGAFFGAVSFAFSIDKIREFHAVMSAFELYSLVSDVAEVISDTLKPHQFLMTYAGHGTFVCVSESGWLPQMGKLCDAVNLSLARTELYDSTGARLHPRVYGGDAIRLKGGSTGKDALAGAQGSAETACADHRMSRTGFWDMGRTA